MSEDEKRTRLKASVRAVTAALLQVLDGHDCEDVVVALAQRIERTARALRDLRPAAKTVAAPPVTVSVDRGVCVCGHKSGDHPYLAATGRVCRANDDYAMPCSCSEYSPLPF